MSELLTLDEAAARLRIAPKTMRDCLRTGKVRGVKTGKYWRVRAEDVDAFIREHLRSVETPAEPEPLPTVDCLETLVALVRAILPKGQRVPLRDRGIAELPLGALNAVLKDQGLAIHATKGRETKRLVQLGAS